MSYTLSDKRKAIVAFVVGAVVFVGGLVSDGTFDFADGLALVGWLGGTLGVYQAKNVTVPGYTTAASERLR